MIYSIYSLLLIILTLGLAIHRKLSIYSPLVISSIVWGMVYLSSISFESSYYDINEITFVSWLIWYLGSSFFYYLLHPINYSKYKHSFTFRQIKFNYSYLLIFTILFLAYKIWHIGNYGPSHFLLNLRISSNGLDDSEQLGLLLTIYPLIFSLFIFENINRTSDNNLVIFLLWILMLMYALATMGKFALLTPVLSWLLIRGISNRLKTKIIVFTLLTSLLIVTSMHFLRAGDDHISTFSEFFGLYIYSPLVAFGYADIPNSQFGGNTFRFIYAVGSQFGLSTKPIDLILPYTATPILTNVYTAMFPFYTDFKFIGVAAGSMAYGILYGTLFNLTKLKTTFFLSVYAALSMALVGQFFGELLFSTLSMHIQTILFLVLIEKFLSREKYEN